MMVDDSLFVRVKERVSSVRRRGRERFNVSQAKRLQRLKVRRVRAEGKARLFKAEAVERDRIRKARETGSGRFANFVNDARDVARRIDSGAERFNKGLQSATRKGARGSGVTKNIAKKEAEAIRVDEIKPLKF